MMTQPPDRCWWCDGSQPKAAGLCLVHAFTFRSHPELLATAQAEIAADRTRRRQWWHRPLMVAILLTAALLVWWLALRAWWQ